MVYSWGSRFALHKLPSLWVPCQMEYWKETPKHCNILSVDFMIRAEIRPSLLRAQGPEDDWGSRQGKLRQLRTHWEHIKKKQPLFPTGKWNSGWPGAAAQTFTAQVTDLQMHLLIITQRSNSILGEHRPQLPSIKDLASRNLVVFLTPFVSYKFRLPSSES